jgi:tRNA(fMet)-specific endonuclease VapC
MPTAGKLLLDTNAVIALFSREPPIDRLVGAATAVFVSTVTMGELFYGARKSARAEENLARLEDFGNAVAVLPCDTGTAREYGLVKTQLRAAARQHSLVLLTRDVHFAAVDGLQRESW